MALYIDIVGQKREHLQDYVQRTKKECGFKEEGEVMGLIVKLIEEKKAHVVFDVDSV